MIRVIWEVIDYGRGYFMGVCIRYYGSNDELLEIHRQPFAGEELGDVEYEAGYGNKVKRVLKESLKSGDSRKVPKGKFSMLRGGF